DYGLRVQFRFENKEPAKHCSERIQLQVIGVDYFTSDNPRQKLFQVYPVDLHAKQINGDNTQQQDAGCHAGYDTPLPFPEKIHDENNRINLDRGSKRDSCASLVRPLIQIQPKRKHEKTEHENVKLPV